MKKIVYNIIYMAMISLLISCVERFDTIEIKEVRATISDFEYEVEYEGRTSYSLGDSSYKAQWTDGDVLGIYPIGGDQVAFPISDGSESNEAVFNGGAWALRSSYAYAAYYPFSDANYTIPEDQIPVTYTGQTQNCNNSFSHFSTYDYLASKATNPDADGNVNLQMKHVGSFFILKLTMPKAGTYTKLALTSDNKEFTIQGKLDLTTKEPSIIPTSTSESITINLKEVNLAKDNELLTVNLMVAPKDLTGSDITIKVSDNKGNVYTTAADQQITGKEYEANKTYSFTRTMVAAGKETPPATEQGHNTEPYFSEAVELMGLIWKLAGANEFSQCEVETVSMSADQYFASMKNHQAVNLAKQYRNQNIVEDAVMGYANLIIINELGVITYDPDYIRGSSTSFERWNEKQKNEMLAAINDFYEESKFHDWFVSTQKEREEAIASFKSVCKLDYSWFDRYYGKNDKIATRIILSFVTGNGNFGISLMRKDGTFLLTPVFGTLAQYTGSVKFYGDMNLIVHELSHPYCNPLIEANWSAIATKANEVYNKVSSIMQEQAYSNAMSMMCETLVRASAIRYMITHHQEDMVNQMYELEESRGFMMVRTLVQKLEKYEQSIGKYTNLADFMPVLIDAINNFDPENPTTPDGADTLPQDYVDLGIEMDDGKKLYFATRNVGETSPAGIGSTVYRWGATEEWGEAWTPTSLDEGWPTGHKLDAAHDIATIEWGGDWHIPSVEEWNLLVEQCDYERKEAYESELGVAGYVFYNKEERSKFIFMPVSRWSDNLAYWTSEIGREGQAQTFRSDVGGIGCDYGDAGITSTGFAIRPVISAAGTFDANGHDYVDLGIQTSDGKKIYFATINVGETSPAGNTAGYRWGTTEAAGEAWIPESNYTSWPVGHRLDAAHDIATIKWGTRWHIPTPEEWKLLVEKCDFERKEADKSGYDVAGYFFYNKKDHSKFIFLPVSLWSDELEYWTSEISEPIDDIYTAQTFNSSKGNVGCLNKADIKSRGYAVRPVFVE